MEEKKREEEDDSFLEQVKKFIEANYAPIGRVEQKEFKTSLELIYMWRETIYVSSRVLNLAMDELGYETIFIERIPNWVLYSKIDFDTE